MTVPKALEDKMMAAMNGPGDTAKLSASAARALKKATLAKAKEARNLAATRKKIVPTKAHAARKAPAKPPIKKAAASKKAVRKTMKTGKKKGR
jgi:hypothetical protein